MGVTMKSYSQQTHDSSWVIPWPFYFEILTHYALIALTHMNQFTGSVWKSDCVWTLQSVGDNTKYTLKMFFTSPSCIIAVVDISKAAAYGQLVPLFIKDFILYREHVYRQSMYRFINYKWWKVIYFFYYVWLRWYCEMRGIESSSVCGHLRFTYLW